MNGVLKQVDLRAFPMEIAEHILALGKDLGMNKGVVAFFEAEFKLKVYLETLSDYSVLYFDKTPSRQLSSVARFATMRVHNPKDKRLQAIELLDFMHYFPDNINEYDFHQILSEDELS